MPELPEVETVRRGLAPVMEGSRLVSVEVRRPDLRFPFPPDFARHMTGWRVSHIGRRAKYLLVHLTSGETLIMHLGMSGRFRIEMEDMANSPGQFHHTLPALAEHDHVVFHLEGDAGKSRITYNDARRFGYMDLMPSDALDGSRHFAGMGPEPLGNEFNGIFLADRLRGKQGPIKMALLDQKVVAGLGNIYVCEALHRAGISPRRKAGTVTGQRAERLAQAVQSVLREAIDAGGSSLRDHAGPDGALGYFQHTFRVYDREGDDCNICGKTVSRMVQSGRSTFFCSGCQR